MWQDGYLGEKTLAVGQKEELDINIHGSLKEEIF